MTQDTQGQGWPPPSSIPPPGYGVPQQHAAPQQQHSVPPYAAPPQTYPVPQQWGPQQPYGAPQWQHAPGSVLPPPVSRGVNGSAVASLVLGIVGGALLSIVFGSVALRQIRSGSGQSGRGLAIAGIVLSGLWIVGVLVGVGVSALSEPTRDESGAVVDGGDVRADAIAVGDCYTDPGGFDDPGGTEVMGLSVVPCSDPHFAETYGEFQVTGTDYPGLDAVLTQAEQGCYDRFEPFVGRSYEESVLDITYLYPLSETWSSDRTVSCAVVDAGGADLVGGMGGSGR